MFLISTATENEPIDNWDEDEPIPILTPDADDEVNKYFVYAVKTLSRQIHFFFPYQELELEDDATEGDPLPKASTKKKPPKAEENRSKKEHVNVVFIGHVGESS